MGEMRRMPTEGVPRRLPSISGMVAGATSGRDGGRLPSIGNLPRIPQMDGDGNDEDLDDDDDDDIGGQNRGRTPDAKRSRVRNTGDDGEDDEFLDHLDNEELGPGDDEDADDGGVDDTEVDNFVLAQHDKVISKKQKWKVQLRDGVIHVNEREYIFSRMQCELDW
uniref:Uncharacterized protein n=1 Tax=Compsopogon caeruleus TaxID=31354 RepID=A0A6T6C081_9RHOD